MSKLFKAPPPPKPEPVTPMPDPEDPALKARAGEEMRRRSARSGRSSTVLDAGGSGGTYGNSLLGQA